MCCCCGRQQNNPPAGEKSTTVTQYIKLIQEGRKDYMESMREIAEAKSVLSSKASGSKKRKQGDNSSVVRG